MILEYLFFEKTKRHIVEKYNAEMTEQSGETEKGFHIPTITYKDFNSTECWIVKYEIDGNNEQVAKQLSDFNEKICKEFSPEVLTNESSEYYNKTLYPLVNKFERSLRKIIYLKVALYKEEKLKKAIQNMDKKDFGEIYNTLFIDEDFRTAAREKIKKLNTRSEMLEAIDGLSERTIWDILIGNSVLTIIKDNFDLLKEYRNDVMHAHNIDYNRFREAKNLFSDANLELENRIELILEKSPNIIISPAAVEALYEKLNMLSDEFEKSIENIIPSLELFSKMLTISINPEVFENINKCAVLVGKSIESTKNGGLFKKISGDKEEVQRNGESEVNNHE